MWTVAVVVRRVLAEQRRQMTLVGDEYPVGYARRYAYTDPRRRDQRVPASSLAGINEAAGHACAHRVLARYRPLAGLAAAYGARTR
jgi:hypothetical protein